MTVIDTIRKATVSPNARRPATGLAVQPRLESLTREIRCSQIKFGRRAAQVAGRLSSTLCPRFAGDLSRTVLGPRSGHSNEAPSHSISPPKPKPLSRPPPWMVCGCASLAGHASRDLALADPGIVAPALLEQRLEARLVFRPWHPGRCASRRASAARRCRRIRNYSGPVISRSLTVAALLGDVFGTEPRRSGSGQSASVT